MKVRREYRFSFRRESRAPARPGTASVVWEFVVRLVVAFVMMGLGGVGMWYDVKYVDPPGRRTSLASMCLFVPSWFSFVVGLGLAWSVWAEAKLHREAKRLRAREGRDAGSIPG